MTGRGGRVAGGLAALALAAGLLGAAAPAAAEPLSLDQAIALALARNPALAGVASGAEAAAAAVREARGRFGPTADLSAGVGRTDNPVQAFGTLLNQERFTARDFEVDRLNRPGPINDVQVRLDLEQPLYQGGGLAAGLRSAELGARGAKQRLARSRDALAFGVTEAYLAVLLADARQAVAGATVSTAEAILADARARVRSGAALESDALSAEVRLAEARQAAIVARQGLELARASLNERLGVERWRAYALTTPLAPDDAPPPPADELIEKALAGRSDLAEAGTAEERAREAVRAARAEFLPRVALRGQVERHAPESLDGGGTSWGVFLTARVNLFSSGRDAARLAGRRAELDQAAAQVRATARAVELDVLGARLAVEAARERLPVARLAVGQAETSLEILRRRYRGGLAPILDVLNTELAWRRARLGEVEARHDLAVERARLDLAVGGTARHEGGAAAGGGR